MTDTEPVRRDNGDRTSEWFLRLIRFIREVVGHAARHRPERTKVDVWFEDHKLHWQVH